MQLDLKAQQGILQAIKESDSMIMILGTPADGVKRNQKGFVKGEGPSLYLDLVTFAQSDKILSLAVVAAGRALDPTILRLFMLSKEASEKTFIQVMAADDITALEKIKEQLVAMGEKELAEKITKESLIELSLGEAGVIAAIKLP
jgi:hypothetical protein